MPPATRPWSFRAVWAVKTIVSAYSANSSATTGPKPPKTLNASSGGSTAINTGTCWRTPDWVLQKWVDQGLDDLAPALMEPYFERVERELQVGPADPAYRRQVAS